MPPLTSLQLQRGTEHLHTLGPRALAGFLEDLAGRMGGMPAILGLLAEYRARMSLDMVLAARADRFPPRPLSLVPHDDAA